MILQRPSSFVLKRSDPVLRTAKVPVHFLTSEIALRIGSRKLSERARMRTTLVYEINGEKFCSSGRLSQNGQRPYRLIYHPTVLQKRDGTKRIGETAPDDCYIYALIERLDGELSGEIDIETVDAEAPQWEFHNSAAFDAATSNKEESGDGVLSFSHANSGTDNLSAFAGVGAANANTTSTSVTYGGQAMTELWDFVHGSHTLNAGYNWPSGVAFLTGSRTVTSTLAALSSADHCMGVITLTGVDGTTPVGTPVSDHQDTNPPAPSVTVGSVGADDLVVDNLMVRSDFGVPGIGANQDLRNTQDGTWQGTYFRQSSQLGSNGGVMSWTGANVSWTLGAVAFKPAGGAAPASNTVPLLLNLRRARSAI